MIGLGSSTEQKQAPLVTSGEFEIVTISVCILIKPTIQATAGMSGI
jgi:hypothetical protein